MPVLRLLVPLTAVAVLTAGTQTGWGLTSSDRQQTQAGTAAPANAVRADGQDAAARRHDSAPGPRAAAAASPSQRPSRPPRPDRPGKPEPVEGAAYEEYVSLGDSWSADVVIADTNGPPDDTHAPVDCAQSHTNYPKLLAAELGVAVHRDATCGSAKTDDFYAPQDGLPLGGTTPAQFDRLTPSTDLVTVGIGGNDAGIAGAAMDCLGVLPDNDTVPPGTVPDTPDHPVPVVPQGPPMGGCKDKYAPEGGEDRLARQIEESEPKLVAAIEEIRRRSPDARILMVDYLAAVPEHACYPMVPISEEDMGYLYATFQRLNDMVRSAAATGGAELVDTYTPTLGHHVCAGPTERYVEVYGPSVNGPAVGVPAHPNSAGAAAQFRAVRDHLL